MRSRVSGMRFTVSFGVSSAAVWLLGPVVKAAGFGALMMLMAGIAAMTLLAVLLLPAATRRPTADSVSETALPPQSPRATD
jgi:hypothetical protein